MNKLKGIIDNISFHDGLALIDFKVGEDLFTTILIESPEIGYLIPEESVLLLFKETEVSLAKNLSGLLSIRNRMKATVKEVEKGKLLSKIILDYKGNKIISIITTRSVISLNLALDDEVEALVKTNEITVMKA